MKTILVIGCLMAASSSFAQTGCVSMGTLTPHASARLDIMETTNGFLISSIIVARRSATVLPSTGLLVYQTDGTA